MSKLRILIVNDLIKGGGVEKLMQDLVWAWHEKYDITIKSDWYDESFYDIFPAGVKYYSVYPCKLRKSEKFIDRKYNGVISRINRRKARKLETDANFDIVIAIKDGVCLNLVSNMPISNKYAWIHTDYTAHYYTRDIFGGAENELEAMRKFKKVVCVAETIKESIIKVIGDPGNLIVKENPINVDNVIDKSDETVVDLDAKLPDTPRFVSAGRLNHQKGYNLLLEAAHMLEMDGYRFEVIIVGGEEPWGDEHTRLYSTRDRLGVKSVNFIGGRKNPYKYIKDADWFISSSIFEGYSLVSQEAAVLDVPLILTECSGVRELIGDSDYGIMCEPSVIGIYNAMKRVLDNPDLRAEYKTKIMERKSIITYRERIDAIEDLFKD